MQLTSGETTHTIYKAHNADDELLGLIREGSAKSICTIRKPENAVLSWLNTYGGEPAQVIDTIIVPWMHLYERIAQHSLVISMEEIEGRRLFSTWKIGRFVCSDYSVLEWGMDWRKLSKRRISNLLKDVEEKKRKIVDGGWTYYDEETFFHQRHISDRSKFDTSQELRLNSGSVGAVDRPQWRPCTLGLVSFHDLQFCATLPALSAISRGQCPAN